LSEERNKGNKEPLSRKHIDIVLVDPQKSENIGAAARAIANMGLGGLVLVRPRFSKPELMEAAATKTGLSVLRLALSFPDLKSALEPHQLIIGTTARPGSHRGIIHSPRDLAPQLLKLEDPPKVAIVFGTERQGLTTEDLRLCHKVMMIPTHNLLSSSLNLAQAVLIIGYELLLAAGGEGSNPLPIVPSSMKDFERAMEDLESVLVTIGFLPEMNKGHWFMNVKKIFQRSQLTRGECDLIQGICRQLRYYVGKEKKED
jgi:tRNA/rRNA methyltransferase